jgi:prepilin-type processing-associated H-X9-DG protein
MNALAVSQTGGQYRYGSALGITALRVGQAGAILDEPMNRRDPSNPSFLLILQSIDNNNGCTNSSASTYDMISGFRSLHIGGCHFLFGDGSVQFLKESISPPTYRALSTISGGEVVNASEL